MYVLNAHARTKHLKKMYRYNIYYFSKSVDNLGTYLNIDVRSTYYKNNMYIVLYIDVLYSNRRTHE